MENAEVYVASKEITKGMGRSSRYTIVSVAPAVKERTKIMFDDSCLSPSTCPAGDGIEPENPNIVTQSIVKQAFVLDDRARLLSHTLLSGRRRGKS
jgi:hypothetical protein